MPLYISGNITANEFHHFVYYYKLTDDNRVESVNNELKIEPNTSILVTSNVSNILVFDGAILDKLKYDVSYNVIFQKENYSNNSNIMSNNSGTRLLLNTKCVFKELYIYCSTATTENKLVFKDSITPNDNFKNNCTKVYLPVQDVVDVESVANLHLPDTVEVIYSIPIGATCYSDSPIKYDL